MISIPHLDESRLAALLVSRICHDLISPVGAINNALELYDDEATMKGEALELIRASAANASARLQFARMAFGASGISHADMDSRDVKIVADLYMNQEKPDLIWAGEHLFLPKIHAKLLLNLLLVANASLPRGGVIEVTLTQQNERGGWLIITAQGSMVKIPPKFVSLLTQFPKSENRLLDKNCGKTQKLERLAETSKVKTAPAQELDNQEIDAHSIQFYYTLLLTSLANMALDCQHNAEKITFTTLPKSLS